MRSLRCCAYRRTSGACWLAFRASSERIRRSGGSRDRQIRLGGPRRLAVRADAGVEPAALSLAITALVEVHLRDERAGAVDAAKALFRARPDVQQCCYVTGGVSFVLVIISR